MGKILIIVTIIFCLASTAYGATIYGSIFDKSLQRVFDVTVEVNSSPVQRQVAKQGMYSFGLYPGSYVLTATKEINGQVVMRADEKILIHQEGTFVRDLFLKKVGEEDEEVPAANANGRYIIYAIVTGGIVLVLIIAYLIIRLLKKGKATNIHLAEDNDQIIDIIKKHGGRTTQKELRKEMSLSEAKVSLMITELESKGRIEKIKKGRGNILILK
jgi:uncharacterized membrane protein